MTYIIGARCKDGVVLIADRKVSGGDTPKFTNKIKTFGENSVFVFTAAGYESIFEEFLEEVKRKGYETEAENNLYNKNKAPELPPKQLTIHDFKHICVDVIKNMKKIYSEIDHKEALQVLIVLPVADVSNPSNPNPIGKYNLLYMDMIDCYPEPRKDDAIQPIGYSHCGGEVFLKQFRKSGNFTMKEIARIGAFIIKYIETEELADGYVGIGTGQPQIVFCKDGELPKEILGKELDTLLENIDGEVVNIKKRVGSASTFLRE